MKNTHKGFSLIELLVVIAIIGILSSVVIVSLNSARAKGRDAKRITDVKQLQLALAMYYDACGRQYPVPVSNALAKNGGSGQTTGPGCPTDTDIDDFINPIPVNPTGGGTSGAYSYFVQPSSGSRTNFVIRAQLENRNANVLDSDTDDANLPSGTWTPSAPSCNDATAPYYYCAMP